jgi:hypothetical protein
MAFVAENMKNPLKLIKMKRQDHYALPMTSACGE